MMLFFLLRLLFIFKTITLELLKQDTQYRLSVGRLSILNLIIVLSASSIMGNLVNELKI
jgi:hypothetical protein